MYSYINIDTYELVSSEEPKESENLIKLDENIAQAIVALNIRGYKTLNSCEGHYITEPDKETAELLIKFENLRFECASAPYIQFSDGIRLPSIPEGWEKEMSVESVCKNGEKINIYQECIRGVKSESSDQTPEEFYKNKMKDLVSLYEWIETL